MAVTNLMSSIYYQRGQQDVYRCLGLTKEAAAPKALQWLAKKMPTWSGTKRFFVGRPQRFMHEVRTKQTMAPGSVLRKGLVPQGVAGKALLYGFPAVEGYKTMQSEPGDRAERMGGLLGGTAAGLAAWGPGGLLGSMAAGAIGERVGRGLARTGKYVAGATPRAGAVQQQANLSLGNQYNMPYTSQ